MGSIPHPTALTPQEMPRPLYISKNIIWVGFSHNEGHVEATTTVCGVSCVYKKLHCCEECLSPVIQMTKTGVEAYCRSHAYRTTVLGESFSSCLVARATEKRGDVRHLNCTQMGRVVHRLLTV